MPGARRIIHLPTPEDPFLNHLIKRIKMTETSKVKVLRCEGKKDRLGALCLTSMYYHNTNLQKHHGSWSVRWLSQAFKCVLMGIQVLWFRLIFCGGNKGYCYSFIALRTCFSRINISSLYTLPWGSHYCLSILQRHLSLQSFTAWK